MNSTVTVTEAQLDWLTATCLQPRNPQQLSHFATLRMADERRNGNVIQKWAHKGYQGYHCGHLEWGIRDDSSIIRVWGPQAGNWFDEVRSCTDHFTRLDVAVTARLEPFNEELAKEAKDALEYRKPGRGFQSGWEFKETSKHGDTLYIGSRASQFYARLYNKQRESSLPRYQSCWRWEVECKQDAAAKLAATLASVPDRQSYIRSAVYQHFRKRGVEPVWTADGSALQGANYAGEPDLDRHADWTRRAIKPMMDKYRGTPGHVVLLEALGIPTDIAMQAAAAAELSA